MADKQNGSKAIGWIRLGIAVIVLMAGVLLAWGNLGTEAALHAEALCDIKEDVASLEVDGCKPTRQNKFDVAIVQKDIQTIQSDMSAVQSDVKDLRKEQQAGFRAILERLPEK